MDYKIVCVFPTWNKVDQQKHELLSRLCKEVNVWVNRLSEETGAMLDPVKVRCITALVRVLSRALKIIKGIALFACFDQWRAKNIAMKGTQ